MDNQTALKLNNLNKEFYQKVATFFDSSRKYNWEGWSNPKFTDFIPKNPLKVLDLGCGNGRFLENIRHSTFKIQNYCGLDFTAELLNKGKNCHVECRVQRDVSRHGAATTMKNDIAPSSPKVEFKNTDLLIDNWQDQLDDKFNLIVAFGLFHHIPSVEFRNQFLQRVKKVLDKEGIFVFTVWNFWGSERQKNKILDLNDPDVMSSENVMSSLSRHGLVLNQFDKNDYLLTWNRGVEAIRYAHAYTEQEVKNLLNDNGFEIVSTFLSDGKEGDLNTYYVVKKRI